MTTDQEHRLRLIAEYERQQLADDYSDYVQDELDMKIQNWQAWLLEIERPARRLA